MLQNVNVALYTVDVAITIYQNGDPTKFFIINKDRILVFNLYSWRVYSILQKSSGVYALNNMVI